MSSIVITIETDGAAFHAQADPALDCEIMGIEVTRILRELAEHIESRGIDMLDAVHDLNGNTCGKVEVIDESVDLDAIQEAWDSLRNRSIGHCCPWCEPGAATIRVEDSVGELHVDGCLWLTMDRLIQESKH